MCYLKNAFITLMAALPIAAAADAPVTNPPQTAMPPGFYAGKLESVQAKINAGKQKEAIEDYRALLLLPNTAKQSFYDQMLLDYARLLVINSQPDAALEALEQAVKAGYADVTQLNRSPAFAPLHSNPRYAAVIAGAQGNLQTRRGVLVLALDNLHIDGDYSQMTFNAADTPRVQELRSRYKLAEIIAPFKTEWERQVGLMDWVHRRWKHSVVNAAGVLDTLFILKEAEAGASFRCNEYAVVLGDCLQASGFPARVVRLERAGSSFGAIKIHYVTEVWNNALGKWAVLDPQNNCFYRQGVGPLNAAEIRDHNLDEEVHDVEVMGLPTPWDNLPRDRNSLLDYYYHLFYYDPNSYFMKNTATMRCTQLVHPKEEIDLLFQQGSREEYIMTRDPHRQPTDLYPVLNATDIQLSAAPSIGSDQMRLGIRLTHSTPWFDHYHVTLNGREFDTKTELFMWDLQPGTNEIRVFTVNDFDIKGKPASVKLGWNTSTTKLDGEAPTSTGNHRP